MKRIIVLLAAVMAVGQSAFAWGGPITSPQLGFPAGTTNGAVKKVINYLSHDVIFVKGNFINEYSTQQFSGSAKKLGELIDLLRTSCKFELKIAFADLKDDRVVFSLFQNSKHMDQLTITVNTTAKEFDWTQLTIHIPAPRDSFEPDLQWKPSPGPR